MLSSTTDFRFSPDYQISRKSFKRNQRWYIRTYMTKLLAAFRYLPERA